MSKLRKRKNLNPTIRKMEVREAREIKPLLTEKVREKLNESYKPNVRAIIKKMKQRKRRR